MTPDVVDNTPEIVEAKEGPAHHSDVGDASEEKAADERASEDKLSEERRSSAADEQVIVQTLSIGAPPSTSSNKTSKPLEEYLFHADQQYRLNETPLTDEREGSAASPAFAIARSPIRFLWGPPTPKARDRLGARAKVPLPPRVPTIHTMDVIEGFGEPDRVLLRRLTTLSSFFIIATDILGPFSAGYVVSQLGFAPAAILYVVFGLCALFAGTLLATLYLRLDSERNPIRSYAGIAQCVWGRPGRIVVDCFLFLQLTFNCAGLLLTNGQSLGQIIDNIDDGQHHICFSVIVLIFLGISLFLSQIRSLHAITPLSMLAVLLCFVSMIACVIFAYSTPPNYVQARISFGILPGPVRIAAVENLGLSASLTGLLNLVFAYGGALLFVDVLNEMRRPWDFYKSLFGAQLAIIAIYMTFGMLMYARQGQFTQSLAYYGLSNPTHKAIGNAIGFSMGTIIALLYGNVAQKQVYYVIVRGWFKGPPLMTRQGFKWWLVGNICFWCIAYVLSISVPQVQTMAGLVAAVCTLQFSFTFPFLLKLTFDIQVDAMRDDKPFTPSADPSTQRQHRVDTWKQWARWKRGLFEGSKASKLFVCVLATGSVGLAFLGIGGCIVAIIDLFSKVEASSFGCATP